MSSPTASLFRFQEAVDWFRARVPMTERTFGKLSNRAQKKGFTVAGVTDLNVVKAVWKAIDAAIEKGETFENFQKRVGPRLSRAWHGMEGNPIARMETVFRNNVQAAYNAGRVRQLKDPDMLEALPFWRFVAILDSRTSTICRPLSDTVLQANAAWFRTRVPPLHHRCRSTIVGISRRAADRIGLTKKAPRQRGTGGFGLIEEDYSPDLKAAPAPLVKVYRRKQAAAKRVTK